MIVSVSDRSCNPVIWVWVFITPCTLYSEGSLKSETQRSGTTPAQLSGSVAEAWLGRRWIWSSTWGGPALGLCAHEKSACGGQRFVTFFFLVVIVLQVYWMGVAGECQ